MVDSWKLDSAHSMFSAAPVGRLPPQLDVASIALVYAVSALTYRVIELPCRRLLGPRAPRPAPARETAPELPSGIGTAGIGTARIRTAYRP